MANIDNYLPINGFYPFIMDFPLVDFIQERLEMAKRKPTKKGSTKTKVKEKVPGTGKQAVPGEGMKKKRGR